MKNIRLVIYGVVGLFLVYTFFFNSNDSEPEMVTEEVITPTEGIITTVKEMQTDQFKIEDEVVVSSPDDSRIIAKYMDGAIDTFTLDEARLVEGDSSHRGSGIMRAASYGFLGFMLGRSMGSFRPSPGAYVDQKTYNKVSNGAGQRMQSTAQRTTVSKPKSGFGGKSSTRSYGG
ncbi:MAG: hypothetical protein AAF806_23640 [Bacteroidota bacterium]